MIHVGVRRAVLVGASAFALSSCVTVQRAELPPISGNGLEGKKVEFTLPAYPDGSPHALSQDLGSVVLVEAWATFCEPCKDSMPILSDVAKEYGPRGLKVYAVSIDNDQRKIGPFLESVHAQVPVLLDPDAETIGRVLKFQVLPSSVLIDRKGVVRVVHEGFAPEFLQRTQTEVEELLNEK